MLTKEDIILKLNELKPILKDNYSVRNIGLFGSFVNKTNTFESDIDLLIEFEKPIGWRFFSLEVYLEKVFNRKVDLVTKDALKEQIKDSILKSTQYI
jgi:predicted nucleotidyltransferase